MIKARYSPATEDLVGQVVPHMSGHEAQGELIERTKAVIESLKDLGYDISIEVEVHGDVEKAFRSLEGDISEYVLHQRPVRRIKT